MMTSFMMSSGSIEVARGNLPEEHLFKLEEAKLLSVLGMPASSLAPKQLSRGSDLSRGIIRNSKLLTPTGISIAWMAPRAGERAWRGRARAPRARVTAQLFQDSKRCFSGMPPRTTSMGPDDVINDVIY